MKTLIFILSATFFSSFLFSQKSVGDEFPVDTITFEDTCFYLQIDTSANNIWQIGEPSKTFFNASFSAPNAIVTDTLNNYPVNNYSYFDLIIDENSFPSFSSQMFFEIKHKIDTDTLKDGGYITISYDKGNTWTNIINDTSYNYEESPGSYTWNGEPSNLYSNDDTLFNGKYGFSGKTDWITTKFSWHYIPCKNIENKTISDTILIRFNFISDNINTGKEGWMIDDIRLYNVDLGGNIKTLSNPKHSVIQTNPIQDKSLIVFDKLYPVLTVQLFNFQGKLLRNQKLYNTKTFMFSRDNLPEGMYFLKLNFNNQFSETQKLIIAN